MTTQSVILLHGFASSSGGTKARYLREQFATLPDIDFHAFDFNPTPRDFEWMTITGMINRLRQHILDHDPARLTLIGSSMGALVALNYAHRFGQIKQLILLAPALAYLSGLRTDEEEDAWRTRGTGNVFHYAFERPLPLRYDLQIDGRFFATPPPPPAPVTLVHGRQDDVIPIQHSRDYATRYPARVTLHEFDADHTLNAHLDAIWRILTNLLQ